MEVQRIIHDVYTIKNIEEEGATSPIFGQDLWYTVWI